MRKSTLFSYFAIWNGHPEDWATDALRFILNRNPSAPAALNKRLLRLIEAKFPVVKRFEVRIGGPSGKGIPDLLGFADVNEARLIIENKFTAALTPHQPASYLKRLPEGGILLFVVPRRRVRELWEELSRRVSYDTSMSLRGHSGGEPSTVLYQKVFDGTSTKSLALTTWQSVLEIIIDSCSDNGDILQLKGLCDDMENIRSLKPLVGDEIRNKSTPSSLSKLLLLRTLLIDAIQQTTASTKLELTVEESAAAATATSNFGIASDDYYFGFSVCICGEGESIAWVGIHLGLWEKYARRFT